MIFLFLFNCFCINKLGSYRHQLTRIIFLFLASLKITSTCPNTDDKVEHFIISPNYPDEYPYKSDCSWTFHLKSTQTLTLKFLAFDVDWEDYDQLYDYVEIFQVIDGKQKQLGKYSNYNKPKVWDEFISEGHPVKVVFKSDNYWNYKGFKMGYEWKNKGNIFP